MAEDESSKTYSADIKKRLKILKEIVGAWKIKTTGKEYVKEVRSG